MLLPLPRALLALACAAPLLVARASSIDLTVGAQCTSVMKGSQASNVGTPLMVSRIPANRKWAMVIQENLCYKQGLALLGYRVKACDADQPPLLNVSTELYFIDTFVTRMGELLTEADLHFYQYCGRKCCKTN